MKHIGKSKPIKNMTEEDFNYYYGILNKKVHKTTTKDQIKEMAVQEAQVKSKQNPECSSSYGMEQSSTP